jgi:hypothetical protein
MQARYLIIAAGLVVSSPLVAATMSGPNQGTHPAATGQMGPATPSSKCGGGCCPGVNAQNTTHTADMQAQSANQPKPDTQTQGTAPQTTTMQAQNTGPGSTKRAFFC